MKIFRPAPLDNVIEFILKYVTALCKIKKIFEILVSHLLISGAAPGHKDDVKAGEATDGEEDEGYDAHDHHGDDGRHLYRGGVQITSVQRWWRSPLLAAPCDAGHG